MHWGNLSFVVTPTFPFELAPVYDMSPMAYRVREDSSFPEKPLVHRAPDTLAAKMFNAFRERLVEDSRVSGAFREIVRAQVA